MGNISQINVNNITECWTNERLIEKNKIKSFNMILDRIWGKKSHGITKEKIENYLTKIKKNEKLFNIDVINKSKNEVIVFFQDLLFEKDSEKIKKFFMDIIIRNLKDKNPCYIISSLMFFTDYGKNPEKIYDNLLELFQLFKNKQFNERFKFGKIDEKYLSIKKFDSIYLKNIIYFYIKLISLYSVEFLENDNMIIYKGYIKQYKRYYGNYILHKEYLETKFFEIFNNRIYDEVDSISFFKICDGLGINNQNNSFIRKRLENLYHERFNEEKINKNN
jgi:hypothetical protein